MLKTVTSLRGHAEESMEAVVSTNQNYEIFAHFCYQFSPFLSNLCHCWCHFTAGNTFCITYLVLRFSSNCFISLNIIERL